MRVLVVHDVTADCEALRRALARLRCFEVEMSIAAQASAAAASIIDRDFAVAIVGADQFLASDARALATALRDTPVIVLTDVTRRPEHQNASDDPDVVSVDRRDLAPSLLETAIRSAGRTRRLQKRLNEVMAEFGAFAAAHRPASSSAEPLQDIVARAEKLVERAGRERSAAGTDPDLNDANFILETARRLYRSSLPA